MKRSGFTMIELVFVIVILGILASVAIPKLAATRDDANIAKSTSEISSLIQDIGSYYTAKGNLEDNVSKMTNVKLYTDSAGTTPADSLSLSGGTATAYYIDKKRTKKCLDIVFNDVNGTVTLSKNSKEADQSIFCKGLAAALSENGMLKEYSFGGSSIY
jgi:general secretion pathway protein G